MPHRIKLSELAHMTPEEFRAEVSSLARAQETAEREGSPSLDARIRRFEVRYEMSSEELLDRLAAGTQRETADICDWLLLLAARGEQPRAVR